MKRFMWIALFSVLLLFSGCAVQPQPSKPKIDPNLPTVSKIRSLSDMTSIALEWNPVYDDRVAGYNIYRSINGKKYKRIAIIKDRYSSHYLDKKLKPATKYFYTMSTYNKDKRESRLSQPHEVSTAPYPEPIAFAEAIDHLPREVKLIWRPHPNPRVQWYVIERSTPENEKWKEVARLQGRLNAEYIDRGLEDKKIYLYRIKAITCDGVESKPTLPIKASTKPRPKVVQGLKATTNLPKKIVVTWQPNSEPDLQYYKVYKSIFQIGPYLVVAKTKSTKYVDLLDEDGVKRYYKVTAVDADGLESFKQDVPAVGQTLPKPLPPVVMEHKLENGTLFIRWASPDQRAVSYIVDKKEIDGILNVKEFEYKNIKSTSFTDAGLRPGVTYVYKIYAVDKYGLVSKPSEKIEIKIPEQE
ncbi:MULTISPECIES: fibronectin type III domain-containing protein [unclassified Nitratiruptor]|uniref:fibronectin type III domain-containing protein n=1 Tax=unclassified Nitratiruptor TaxID=2624044 RepID=UPI0019167961|nr:MULTISPECIES: fibronectin type III domain-containing protein [unclassified Nitratiruptor]BCD60526.1 hypothetical protein NitYY0810_C1293 [Nitratiruptor sp. YY08-10]BCD63985.1 hypothetical protein NitYY0814_C0828 [Nitratiruptor sp. YY08-14]